MSHYVIDGVDSLPDELVKEILSEILVVSEDDFIYVGPSSPFGCNAVPSSEVLLVSKRWLRIGSPLFHECVVLRNSAQANAFYGFIKGKIGGQVRGYVRRVRLEGNFGAIIGKIFAALPNITELSLRLPGCREENVTGLVQGLSGVNPDRVVLGVPSPRLWKNSLALVKTLSDQVKQWSRLRTFRLHLDCVIHDAGDRQKLKLLCDALSAAPCLEEVTLSHPDNNNVREIVERNNVLVLVKAVGGSISLRSIHVHISRTSLVDDLQRGLVGEPCEGKVHFHPRDIQKTIAQMPRPCSNIGRVAALPENVLGRIIEMDLRDCLGEDPLCVALYHLKSYEVRAVELFCVSRTFYRVASALAFRFVAIHLQSSSLTLWKKLMDDPIRLTLVDTLVLARIDNSQLYLNPGWRSRGRNVAAEATARQIVSSLPTVRRLFFDTEFETILECMPEECKLKVRNLHMKLTEKVFRQRTLTQFKNVTTLILDAGDGSQSVDMTDIVGRPSFDDLVTLKIYKHFDFMRLIQSCDFPSLQSLYVTLPGFGSSGGTQAWEVPQNDYWPTFPKIKFILVEWISRESCLHLLQSRNCGVEKLVLLSVYLTRKSLQEDERKEFVHILNNINFDNLPALRELQLESVNEWPWQDHELKDDAWQKCAQALIDKYGFQITDGRGVPWRPRLMKRKNKKRRVS